MKSVALKIVLFLFAIAFSASLMAQVRVRRVKGKYVHKQKYNNIVQEQRRKKSTEIVISPKSKIKDPLDALFYLSWKAKRPLSYSDFRYNRNLYNKFLPTRDTDLANVIYPDYREFYKRLSERLAKEEQVYDEYWQEKLNQVTRPRPDGDAVTQGATIPDTGYVVTITIDSPAASVINIAPIIYVLDPSTFYFNITPMFSLNDSWMIVKSKDILEHEQIHFDIFELFARKMRKHLVETLRENYDYNTDLDLANEITPVFEQLYQQLNNMQFEFDKQTGAATSANATLLYVNAAWRKMLKTQIDKLKEYAISEGNITIR